MDGILTATLLVLAGGTLPSPATVISTVSRIAKSNAPRPAFAYRVDIASGLLFVLVFASVRAALRGAVPVHMFASPGYGAAINRVIDCTRGLAGYNTPVDVTTRSGPQRWLDSTKTITAAFRTLRVPVMSSTSTVVDAHKALRRTAERAGDSVRVAILDEALNAALTFHAGFVPEVSQ